MTLLRTTACSATLVVLLTTSYGCGLTCQMLDPNLRQVAQHHGGTIPNQYGRIVFQLSYWGDDDFSTVFPYLSRTRVTNLSLRGTQTSDLSVSLIVQLKDIHKLDVSRTRITYAGLTRLRQLPRLQRLSLHVGQITAEEKLELERALPHTTISEWPEGPPFETTNAPPPPTLEPVPFGDALQKRGLSGRLD